jgi:nucleoside-diphosphate-sugar epimerase
MDSFRHSFGLPVTIVRPFNTYGPFQSARAVVPTIVTQALVGSVVRLGALHPRRDLTFVRDTAAGFIAAAQSDKAIGRTLQLGTGRSVAIGELAEAIGELLGRELIIEQDVDRIRPVDSEVEHLISSPALARSLTGWEPVVPLREGLQETIEWIKDNLDRYRVGQYAV